MTQSATYIVDEYCKFTKGLVIALTTFNRQTITQLCIEQIQGTVADATLWIIDDYSTDYNLQWLQSIAPNAKVIQAPHKMGVERLRLYIHKLALAQGFSHIYHTDNDAYHDPTWLSQLFSLYQQAQSLADTSKPKMLSLYSAKLHEPYTIAETAQSWLRTTCQGLSMCYKLSDMPHIDDTAQYQNWDIYFGGLLRPTLVSKVSYMEHLGGDGLHNAKRDFYGDTAVNPTAWLMVQRSQILKNLGMPQNNPNPSKITATISFNRP